MGKYFDSTFWRESTGFLVIVFVVLAGIILLQHYSELRYSEGERRGSEPLPVINQEARNSGN